MTAATAASQPAPAKAEGRSPFVRLHELLADIKPGKPAINLSVGEPQHPIPPFVGPVLAAHLNDFGRYPANKGTEGFRKAAAAWLDRRYKLGRPMDHESEVHRAQRHARGPVPRRDRRQALRDAARRQARDPDPQSVLCRLFGGRRGRRVRAGLSADHARNRLPARPRRHRREAAGAHGRVLSRLAVEPAGRGRRRGLSDAPRRAWRAASAS